jgi:dUTP pyrophosphatase|tara:strand:+ start:11983 stop:12432 length:450 start_codon:yes stop_codon:yes gene_type:complete
MTDARFAGKTIKVKKTEPNAIIPTRANKADAGWDLYSLTTRSLAPQQRAIYRTGISLQIPEGHVGLLWPRSGLSVKSGVDVLAGVIDSGYRGEVQVCLLNTSNEDWVEINEGDRIAQILFQEVPEFQLQQVDVLQNSGRGAGGFGSSGK